MINEKYEDIKHLINEGDVLLFRGNGLFSRFVRAYSISAYSHVGILSWSNGDSNTKDGILELIEFREGLGGRTVILDRIVQKYSGLIDVHRPCKNFSQSRFNSVVKEVEYVTIPFDGKVVTKTIRRLTGLSYGWRRVWWIIKYRLLLLGLYNNYESMMNDETRDVIYPVCSSVVAYAFSKNYYDLIKNKSDEWTSPGDIATSPRLSYLFTLVV